MAVPSLSGTIAGTQEMISAVTGIFTLVEALPLAGFELGAAVLVLRSYRGTFFGQKGSK